MTEKKKKAIEDIFMGGQFKKSEHIGYYIRKLFLFSLGVLIAFQWLSVFNFQRHVKNLGVKSY